jgi:uncharacterized repeat protein (TIGR03803 family)
MTKTNSHLLAFLTLCLAGTASLQAQVTILANLTNGANPLGGLTLSGSTLYGSTADGGTNGDGEVFSLPVGGGTPTVLANFSGLNGDGPQGELILSGSTLYGTASSGGSTSGDGEVFSLPVGGGTPTVLSSFNGTNGENPYVGLTLSGSTLYGTAFGGGADGHGDVFSVPVGGGTLTDLADFNITNGANPESSLLLSADGSTLYGTTADGGTNGNGVVFSVPTGVPEPGCTGLMVTGLIAFTAARRRTAH